MMIKTKEFIKRVEILGYEINKNNFFDGTNYFVISNSFGRVICYVAINKVFEVNIRPDESMSEELFDLVREYACTPVKDREEEKKFLIKHKYLVSKNLLPVNLAWNKLKDVYRSINLKVDNHIYQAQFTFKEYEEIKKKLNTDLADFELIEVEE
uniref:Uncharacterized protein n=1 Tax=Firmicutes phage HS19 TaxID=3056397 RepID=A0AA49X4T2_9VIRU|nr:MAG: hypothetical protein [Firmicutes phage HS19]DAU66091.1 MAG TPA: hypothetical protein [Caudoviricetes sp.]